MGILRSDRVSGLGGANAINGSVFFGNGNMLTAYDSLKTETSSDFIMGTGDFTLEGWFYLGNVTQSWQALIGDTLYGSAGGWTFYVNTNQLNFWKGGSSVVSGGTLTANTWHHIAYSRASGSNRLFIDGALAATASDSTNYTDNQLSVGANNVDVGGAIGANGFDGYASNVRVTKGTALYTAAFTPPTTRLEKRSDTVLLCCQSPGNAEQEATGKIITARGKTTASHFVPDKGEDHGTTFEDNTKFDTLSYMVPPGGTTVQRGRGRGLIMGGRTPATTSIEYIQIQSTGNGTDFGDLNGTMEWNSGGASSTRGFSIGGNDPVIDTIDYVTIATASNAIDFGNLTVGRRYPAISGNETRCVSMAGYSSNAPYFYTNIIDYITTATAGNATDFGDTDEKKTNGGGVNSSTRGIIGGGQADSPYPKVNTLEYITIASLGNAQNFGDLTVERRGLVTASSSTRGIFGGGVSPTAINTIDYVTIATTGNATDFGDTTAVIKYGGSGVLSSHTRGVLCHSGEPTATNILDYVIIASTGNANDFGDLLFPRKETCAVCSDSHGGIE